jgi:hypothetical protein
VKRWIRIGVLGFAGTVLAPTLTANARVFHHHRPAVPVAGFVVQPQTQAVYVGGTYAGADPDPNIRAALAREFGKRR